MQIKGTPPSGPAAAQAKAAADGAKLKAIADDAKAAGDDAKLKAACTELEAVFLNMLMTQMRKTVPKGGLVGGSNQEEIFRSMLDGEVTKNMAHAGGVGLADMLYRQLSPDTGKNKNKGQAPR